MVLPIGVCISRISALPAGEGSTHPSPCRMSSTAAFTGLAGAQFLTEVHISRGCMDHSSSYSFSLEKTEDNWFLSFDCAADCVGYHTNAEKIPVDTEEAEEILRTVRERRLVSEVLSYEAPSESDVYVLDETTYNTSVCFFGRQLSTRPDKRGQRVDRRILFSCGRKIKK